MSIQTPEVLQSRAAENLPVELEATELSAEQQLQMQLEEYYAAMQHTVMQLAAEIENTDQDIAALRVQALAAARAALAAIEETHLSDWYSVVKTTGEFPNKNALGAAVLTATAPLSDLARDRAEHQQYLKNMQILLQRHLDELQKNVAQALEVVQHISSYSELDSAEQEQLLLQLQQMRTSGISLTIRLGMSDGVTLGSGAQKRLQNLPTVSAPEAAAQHIRTQLQSNYLELSPELAAKYTEQQLLSLVILKLLQTDGCRLTAEVRTFENLPNKSYSKIIISSEAGQPFSTAASALLKQATGPLGWISRSMDDIYTISVPTESALSELATLFEIPVNRN